MSTLAEVRAAVEALPSEQQEEIYVALEERLRGQQNSHPTPEEFAEWLQSARGAARPGVTTSEIMALTRDDE